MNTKKLLIIAAVAVMLAGATSAYGYDEWWIGGCGSGTLTYNGNDYTFQGGTYSGTLHDETSGSVDVFDENDAQWHLVFVCYVQGEDMVVMDSLVIEELSSTSYFTGEKDTGTRGLHYGEGTYWAECTNKNFYFTGDWYNTTFNYNNSPPTASGSWNVTNVYPSHTDFDGGGTFGLTQTGFQE